MSMTQYYGVLAKLWQEFDLFFEADWSCSQDSVKYNKMVEKEIGFEFLAGLNKELDEVRGRVLRKEILPSIREVFTEVRREKSKRRVMMGESAGIGSQNMQSESESSALVSKGCKTSNRSSGDQRMMWKGEKVWCEFFHKPWHTKATCWKLHGKPANWKPNKLGAKQVHVDVEDGVPTKSDAHSGAMPFSKEQLEHLYELINQSRSGSFSHSCSIAEPGNSRTALHDAHKSWVIDSGASNHMSGGDRE
ncbi:uncharacterized protein LOC116133276 isoform X2 [Pistacia vera]|uniref:uncharacterized protein LOC116133276 isoform X2 n=1 Tax=Pistacia vera TaxID=55513 RepID=UPI001263D1D8|nr:uncharacterized protein LOC116133276 isoform X2 [Pistacia vera]